jgi:uncharacterized protein (TIGR02284 family)
MQTMHDQATTLNHLINICRDGQKGFDAAAQSIKDAALRAELIQYSQQRQNFARELQAMVDDCGEAPQDGGTVSGAMHRGWMKLKEAIASNDRYAVLAECERGEDSAIEAYRDAIAMDLSAPAAVLVETQYQQIDRVHDRIRALRDAARPM